MIQIGTALADPKVFEPWFSGSSWDGWRAVLRAAFGEKMTKAERAFFRSVANRDPPDCRVRELWCISGRRSGKDSIASVVAAHVAASFEPAGRLRPGERALVACLAVDRAQAQTVLGYTRSYFERLPALAALVKRATSDGFELTNDVDIAIVTNDYRASRGRTVLCGIFDEVSYWPAEGSTSPDVEVYRALRPGMATLPGSMLIGITTAYRRQGLAYDRWAKHFGHDSSKVLVIHAPSTALNPLLPQAEVDDAMAEDPEAARADYLSEWRDDIAAYISRDVVDSAVVKGRHELPPVPGARYAAFVDPSGGSSDSMTLAIAHRGGDGHAILDALRECRPPFSPMVVVAEFAALLKRYCVSRVTGDRWGGEFVREPFRSYGIEYELAEKAKSDIYRDALSILNSGEAELLDAPRLVSQLCGLERRTARGGRDSIDHGPNAHDDLANAAAGAISLTRGPAPMIITGEHLQMLAAAGRYGRAGPMEARNPFILGEREQARAMGMRRGRVW